MPNLLSAPHPGVLFLTRVLKPCGTSVAQAARQLDVPRETLRDFTAGKSPLDPALALKIGAYTGTGATIWMLAQARYSLQEAFEAPGVKASIEAARQHRTDRMAGMRSAILEAIFPSGLPRVFNYFFNGASGPTTKP